MVKLLGDSADKYAKAEFQRQASELRKEFEVRSDHHATFGQRLEYLENMFGDSADKLTQWEGMHVDKARLQKQQEEQQGDRHASLQE